MEQLTNRTETVRAYKNLEKLGEGVDLSYEEFLKEYDKTDREKFLRAAMGDEDLMSAAKDLAKSGRSQINIGQDTLAREQAKQQADVLGPSAESDIRARLKKQDSIKWRGGETAKKIADAEGIPYSEGQKIHQDAMVRMELDKEIRRVLHGQGTVTYKKGKGWFLDGKLVREDI